METKPYHTCLLVLISVASQKKPAKVVKSSEKGYQVEAGRMASPGVGVRRHADSDYEESMHVSRDCAHSFVTNVL